MNKKIGLALSGGGGLGFAHLGVLEVLEEYNIKPSFVAGTSMGSIVGGLYASGISFEKLMQTLNNLKRSDFVDINVFNIVKNGLIQGNKLEKYLSGILHNKKIENFKIPFTAVTTDLLTGKEVLLNKGSGAFALRASSAVPGVFAACPYKDKLLADGGMLNNLPANVVKDMGADYVIAVDCIGEYLCESPPKNIVEYLICAGNIMVDKITKMSPKKYNTLIKINGLKDSKIASQKNFEKDAIEEALNLGRLAAKKQISKIVRDINNLNKNN